MKTRFIIIALAAVATAAQAASADYYLKIEGVSREAPAGPIYLKVSSNGDLDGDGVADEAVLRITCAAGQLTSAHYTVPSPRDAASGMPTGKRQHGSVTIVKEWGAATPQLAKMRPGYNVKENKGAKLSADAEGWRPIELTDAADLCAAAGSAVKATKTRSNIQNN